MAKNNKFLKTSPQTQDDAMKVAKATQRPGQTKEQTKLIAQGVEKAITHYKKQQKEKSRDLNRKLQKVNKQASISVSDTFDKGEVATVYKQSLVAWVLLVVSWLGFAAYIFL